MSNSNKINLVSNDFVKMARNILKEHCLVDAETGDRTCVSREVLAVLIRKTNRKALPTKNLRVLESLLEAAEQAGQFVGFASRRGRNGGFYKTDEKRNRKPRKVSKAKVQAEVQETPVVQETQPAVQETPAAPEQTAQEAVAA